MNLDSSLHASNTTQIPQCRLSNFALLCLACFIILSVLVHLVNPAFNPLQQMLSEYVLGAYGILLSFALLSLGLGSLALWSGLRRSLSPSRWMRTGLALLLVWAVGTCVAGLFPTDPGGIPVSANGIIHGLAASLAFFSFIVAALCLSIHFRREAHWRSVSAPALFISVVLFPLLGFFSLPDHLRGGGEKLFVAVVVIWLTITALRLHQLNRKSSARPG